MDLIKLLEKNTPKKKQIVERMLPEIREALSLGYTKKQIWTVVKRDHNISYEYFIKTLKSVDTSPIQERRTPKKPFSLGQKDKSDLL